MGKSSVHLFTSETGKVAGQKGGKALRVNGVRRTPEYRAGYEAGYKAGVTQAVRKAAANDRE